MPPINGANHPGVSDSVSTKEPITIAVCMPQQQYSREDKLKWLDCALRDTVCHLFLTPQEYFGGHYVMSEDLHMDDTWMNSNIGALARKHKKCIGVGACEMTATTGAMENYIFYSSSGQRLGHHSKFALPSYDDMRTGGHGQLWPETNYRRRTTPIDIPELRLRIGTIFCWEVFSQTLWGSYSFERVNLIVHPIKFAPRGWLNNKKSEEDGKLHIVGFGNAPKSQIWIERLIAASKFQCLCPIAVSCNSWDLGLKFNALVGYVDELRGSTELFDIAAIGAKEFICTFQILPEWYTGLDHHHSAGAFKAHTGSVEGYSELSEWTMAAKIRRLEAHLIGGTTAMECALRGNAESRQKQSIPKRAFGAPQKVRLPKRKG